MAQVAAGRRHSLRIYGHDYLTRDGTGVRDYVHVVDIAAGHLTAIDYLLCRAGMLTVNLGTGKGYSVLEVLQAFERTVGRPMPYEIATRRSGDVAEYYANPSLAARLMNWRAKRSLEQMCQDTWRWHLNNPNGYES